MKVLARLAKAIGKDESLRKGAEAAAEVLKAAISGDTEEIESKYGSWTELDLAYRGILREQVKSSALRTLLELAVSAAVSAASKGR